MGKLRAYVALVMIVMVACVPPPVPSSAPTWMFGDSIAGGSTASYFGTRSLEAFNATRGGGGFIRENSGLNIVTRAQQFIDANGAPRRALIMGGVNDVNYPLADVLVAMQSFEDDLIAQGIEVVWLTEPGWARAEWLAPLNDWIRGRANSIDCAPVIADSGYAAPDQVHPSDVGYSHFADCVAQHLPPLD